MEDRIDHDISYEEKELRQVVDLWDKAMEGNDVNEIGRYMSEDWEIISSDGITSKMSFLHVINTRALTHHTMNSDEMKIRVYGNTGIVISRGTSAGTWKGEAFSLYEWSTSIFIREEGHWLCKATMLTPAKKP